MEDWEEIILFVRKEKPKNMWDDEDVDETSVKDSWEDEDEPTRAPKVSKEKKAMASKVSKQALMEEAKTKSGEEKISLNNLIPKTESDFMEYAELVSHKLRTCENSFYYKGLLKTLIRLSLTNLEAVDVKEIASSVSEIANGKIKAERERNAVKKKTRAKKKQQVQVDKPYDDAVINASALDDDFL
ncbi:eukaryotic translation initiation factor 3 subunit J-like [Macadamia integrifolia]|uniref:eukaryotic translation initiation factor 3 subunit J-like n=1 Tax=Macadamia integrifolia TaxID=60698 RepID=UPI001C4F75E1|nr:eukaryotic translation initiation factor 3 subunit J-like [Macadamia integrifolia]